MWYGHIPLVKHLMVFGSTCYALIPKVHRNKLGARSRKCIFLEYSNTSKAYRLYDKVNKKFVVYRDAIFLESSKTDNVVERQLDRLDRFTNGKSFQEFDNQIAHLEEWIPILDQPVESSSEALSPPHETRTTDDTLSDVIDRIGRLNLDSIPTQSTGQPGPSKKGPSKWLTKTLESVHPDEVGNTGTRNSNRQNGGDVDDSDSPVDMDVSYDYEFNSSTYFEPTSFKKVASHDEWKEVMQKEYDALIETDSSKLVDPPLGTKPTGCKWVYKNTYKVDGSLYKHKAMLAAKGFAQKEGVDYEETFAPTRKWTTIRTLFALAAQDDDLLMKGNNESYIASIKKELRKGFEITDLGYVHYYLGIEVTQHLKSIFHSQKKYIGYLLNRFGMTECNPLTTPMEQYIKLTSIEGKEFEDATKYRQLVGSLNYLTTTRPDISFAIRILSKFMEKPCEGHWSAAKIVLRYLKGTQDFGIKYKQVDDFTLIGYSDSNFDGDKETGVSTLGYAMNPGSGVVS
eukprot:PITA_20695